jgi:hypothetical protein
VASGELTYWGCGTRDWATRVLAGHQSWKETEHLVAHSEVEPSEETLLVTAPSERGDAAGALVGVAASEDGAL